MLPLALCGLRQHIDCYCSPAIMMLNEPVVLLAPQRALFDQIAPAPHMAFSAVSLEAPHIALLPQTELAPHIALLPASTESLQTPLAPHIALFAFAELAPHMALSENTEEGSKLSSTSPLVLS